LVGSLFGTLLEAYARVEYALRNAGTAAISRSRAEDIMAKGQEKPGKNNKPKLSTKDKQKKKKEKAASK
jgi:hypothetical protein